MMKIPKDIPGFEAGCSMVTDMMTKSVQLMASMQKSTLDMAVQQSGEIAENCKRSVKGTMLASSASMFDLAAQSFEKYAGLQKGYVDLAVEQANTMTQVPSLQGDPAKAFSGVVQQTIDRAVTAQKMALDVASQQNKAVAEAVKQQLSGTPMAAAAESFQRGMDALIETQKNVLEIAAKPLKATAASA